MPRGSAPIIPCGSAFRICLRQIHGSRRRAGARVRGVILSANSRMTGPKFLRHLEIGFAHIEEAANKLNSFVSANVAQIKRLQVVNFVVFCVVLANFLKNPCHNTIFSNMKIRITQGTGSYPLPPQGWQRSSLRTVRYSPLKGPCLWKASSAY